MEADQQRRIVHEKRYFLQGYVDRDREVWRVTVHHSPFVIGRREDCDLVIPSSRVSQLHAELFFEQNELWLSDCQSTNGTFVNGRRQRAPTRIDHGDVLHFADSEFRLLTRVEAECASSVDTLTMQEGEAPERLFEQSRVLREMLREGSLRVMFQPVVSFCDLRVIGYELLGRGESKGHLLLPRELFFVAELAGLEIELSHAFRARGFEEARSLPPQATIFLNTHPAELADNDKLLTSMQRVREYLPQHSLVLEIHERAIADMRGFQTLRADLAAFQIDIAFDDFGTGQARLLELLTAEPRYVKFDRAWIADLHAAPFRQRDLVEKLVRIVKDMGIATVAEGVEHGAEAQACRDFGFEYAQGFHFGYPAPVATFLP